MVFPAYRGMPRLQTRNLLYTAVTRAKQIFVGVGEPEAAVAHRRQAASVLVEKLKEITGIGDFARHHWALWGWVGFLEAGGRRWVEAGCPEEQRWPLIDAALGALEGALGDWRV